MVTGIHAITNKLPRSAKSAAFVASLALSAYLTAAAWRSPDHHWLAWFSFLPLFMAIRLPRPAIASLAGAGWGACLCWFCVSNAPDSVDASASAGSLSASLIILMIVIPAVYLGLVAGHARPGATSLAATPGSPVPRKTHPSQESGASRARVTVCNLLLLALGWTLIEVVLHLHNPSRARIGLLTGPQGGGSDWHWFARLLAYVASAFVVACVNASLVRILIGPRPSFPPYRPLARSPKIVGWLLSQVLPTIQSWTLRQAHPRAPPLRAPTTS